MIKLGIGRLKEITSPDKVKVGRCNDNGRNSAQIGSSGNFAKIGSSGNFAKIGSSGDYARIKSEGMSSVICCAGNNSAACARKGSWITLSEWKYNNDRNMYIPVCVKTEFVDGERIKEDTWYKLVNGEFKEIKL